MCTRETKRRQRRLCPHASLVTQTMSLWQGKTKLICSVQTQHSKSNATRQSWDCTKELLGTSFIHHTAKCSGSDHHYHLDICSMRTREKALICQIQRLATLTSNHHCWAIPTSTSWNRHKKPLTPANYLVAVKYTNGDVFSHYVSTKQKALIFESSAEIPQARIG